MEKAGYPAQVAAGSFYFVLSLVRECVMEVSIEHEVSKFLLCRTPVKKPAGAELANNSKVQKQGGAQQITNPLVCSVVSLGQKCFPLLVVLGQFNKGAVELLSGQGKYLDRLNEPKARGIGSQQLLILLSSARHDYGNLTRQSTYELVKMFREMLPEPHRNLVESIEDERVSIRSDQCLSGSTLTDLIAYRSTKVVDEEGFEALLSFPRREVDQ